MAKLKHQNNNFLTVKFENMVASPSATVAEVAEYLELPAPNNLQVKKTNSSFQNKKKQELSSTEIWLIEKIIGRDMEICDYQLSGCKPSLRGFWGVLKVSFIFTGYQVSRAFKKKSALVSIKTFLHCCSRRRKKTSAQFFRKKNKGPESVVFFVIGLLRLLCT